MIGPTKHCPQGIGLILVDLDDTVLVDGTKLSPRVVDALALARERGCMVGVASGRPLSMVPGRLQSPEAMDYLICVNGAVINDSISGILYENLMTSEQVLALMDALEPLHAGWNTFIGDMAYFEWRNFTYMAAGRTPTVETLRNQGGTASLHTGVARYVRKVARFAKRMVIRRGGSEQVVSIRPFVEAAEHGVPKVGCSLPTPDACERAIAIIEHMGAYQVARMGRQELEVTARGVSKATAARWLMDYLKIDPACAVAFGDSENDVPLSEACGIFVAMGNADAHVKELADDICESVYDDGVARWIERALDEADGARNV